jgi:hypothetical protein
LTRVVEHGQRRGWLRRDVSAHSLAVLLQGVVFGRSLDDVSSEPIGASDWSRTLYTLFSDLLGARVESIGEDMN